MAPTGYAYKNGLVQDCSNSSALAMELPQCCAKLMIRTLIGSPLWLDCYQANTWTNAHLL